MIVFYFCIGIIVFISIIFLSTIMLNAHNININNLEELKKIYCAYTKKNYNQIFKFIDLNIDINIFVLGIIPIKIIKLDSKKIRKIIIKIKTKQNVQKQKNKAKYEIMKKKQKELANKIIPKLLCSTNINKAELKVDISLSNMGVTAIITSFLNIAIAMIITFIEEDMNLQNTNENIPKKVNKRMKYINYKVTPIYITDFYFKLHSKLKLKIPIYKIFYAIRKV